MPRKPTLECSRCGRPMWLGRGVRTDGTQTCLACRRLGAALSTRPSRVVDCKRCGRRFATRHGTKVYCSPECSRRGRNNYPRKRDAAARGYGYSHQRERRRWKPLVDAGEIDCWRCRRPILIGEPWDLGHDDNDRTIYRGPEHRECNRRAAARKGNRQRGHRAGRLPVRESWNL